MITDGLKPTTEGITESGVDYQEQYAAADSAKRRVDFFYLLFDKDTAHLHNKHWPQVSAEQTMESKPPSLALSDQEEEAKTTFTCIT